MTQYNSVNVKLSNSQIIKLKSLRSTIEYKWLLANL